MIRNLEFQALALNEKHEVTQLNSIKVTIKKKNSTKSIENRDICLFALYYLGFMSLLC